MDSVNGAMRLHLGDYKQVRVAHVVRVNEDGSRGLFVSVQEPLTVHIRVRATVEVRDADGNIKAAPASPVTNWISLAERDRLAAEVLWLFSLEKQDWDSVYKLHELVEQSGGLGPAVASGLTSKTELELLTWTDNDISAAGRAACHAKLNTPPRKKQPMELSNAVAVMRRVAAHWLEQRSAAAT